MTIPFRVLPPLQKDCNHGSVTWHASQLCILCTYAHVQCSQLKTEYFRVRRMLRSPLCSARAWRGAARSTQQAPREWVLEEGLHRIPSLSQQK